MKRKTTVLLFLVLAVFLSSCSFSPKEDPSDEEPVKTPTVTEEQAPGITKGPEPEESASALRLLAFLDESFPGDYTSMAVSPQEAVILLTDITGSETAEPTQYFQFIDLEQHCLTDCVPIEVTENGELYQIAFGQDGSLLLSNAYRETAARYDRTGKLLETIPNRTEPQPEIDHKLTDDWFTVMDPGFAYYHCYEGNGYLFSAYAFEDDPEALYLLDGGYDAAADADGHRILESDYLPDGAGLQYRVLDLDAGVCEDTVMIANEAEPELADDTYLNADEAQLCGDRALLKVTWTQYDPERAENGEYGEGEEISPAMQVRIYEWQFRTDDPAPVDVQRVTEEELYQKNADLINEITEEYPLNLLIGSEPDGETPEIPTDYDGKQVSEACREAELKPLRTYELLLQLRSFLEKLPAGFLSEMQSDFPGEEEESGFSGLDIYLIREIPGDTSAYANTLGQRMAICFAVDEFSATLLPHEFMHLIEYRIHAWYEAKGESFWERWSALNPPETETVPEDWYVSFYAATNDQEDRAETFAQLFMEQRPLEESDWYQAHPPIQEKVRLLTEAIRNAYPSVENADSVIWEK